MSGNTECTAVVIKGDALEEPDELFLIHLVPVPPDITPEGKDNYLSITIYNDDGKLYTISSKNITIWNLKLIFLVYFCSHL